MIPINDIDGELEGAPLDVKDAWKVVRGYLRRRQRPSSTQIEAVTHAALPPAAEHFRAAGDALRKKLDE